MGHRLERQFLTNMQGIYFMAILFLVQTCNVFATCTSDSDCALGTVCIQIDTGRETHSKCTPSSASKPACRGRLAGKCPSRDSRLGPLICVFKKTTKIRGATCCNGKAITPVEEEPAAAPTPTDAISDEPVNTPSEEPAEERRLQEDCFECFPDPVKKNETIAGEYECVLESMCSSESAFPKACDTGLSCDTTTGTYCSGEGTCAPKDEDDPIQSFRCLCNAGFYGRYCEKIASNACSVDCGSGGVRGDCVDNECDCKSGYTGDQCAKCSSDKGCNGDADAGTCTKSTGICKCEPGFQGSKYCKNGGEDNKDGFCEDVECGDKGVCEGGECICKSDCIGSQCRKCSEEDCSDCNDASVHSVSFLAMLASFLAYQLL